MYETFYGLRERPFNLVPDPRFLFLSKQHREALAHLQYGLTGRPGVTVLVGEAGTGKTTLVRKALEPSDQPSENRVVQLSNPTLTRSEFYEYLAVGFRFPDEAATSKPRFLAALETTLTEQSADAVVAIVVDEAQSLPHELLEEIRLLTNLQTANGRALTMILVGQPELADRLNEGRLRQLKQRISLRCELAPLDLQDVRAYIATRVAVAGGQAPLLFTDQAIAAIHKRSHGIPRTISVICDNALINGFAANVKPIGPTLIDEVCRDFHIGDQPGPQAAEPMPAETPEPRPPRPGIFSDPVQEATQPAEGETDTNEPGSMFAGFAKKRRFFVF